MRSRHCQLARRLPRPVRIAVQVQAARLQRLRRHRWSHGSLVVTWGRRRTLHCGHGSGCAQRRSQTRRGYTLETRRSPGSCCLSRTTRRGVVKERLLTRECLTCQCHTSRARPRAAMARRCSLPIARCWLPAASARRYRRRHGGREPRARQQRLGCSGAQRPRQARVATGVRRARASVGQQWRLTSWRQVRRGVQWCTVSEHQRTRRCWWAGCSSLSLAGERAKAWCVGVVNT